MTKPTIKSDGCTITVRVPISIRKKEAAERSCWRRTALLEQQRCFAEARITRWLSGRSVSIR